MIILFKNYKRNILATLVGVLLLLIAFPVVASAAPAIVSLDVNRTSVSQGQTITFTMRTTPQVNYVFANVDGARVQGTRTSDNAWSVVVSPSQSQNITLVANTTNSIDGAATLIIPVTVVGAAAAPPSVPAGPFTPTAPTITPPRIIQQTPNQPNQPVVGGLAINSITETAAIRANYVQLTIETGVDANEVWVRFDNNPYRFRRGVEQTELRTATTRTWVIDFRPQRWAAQSVQVSANRSYVVSGATNRTHTLTLTAPFVPAARPSITNIGVGNRNVTPGVQTTFTVTTNRDVSYVWLHDINGERRNASRTNQTANAQTWSVSFIPPNNGVVRVYANTTNTTTGAVTRTETLNVTGQTISFVSAHASWQTTSAQPNRVRVEVVTNAIVERVWVDLPGGNRQRLTRHTGGGTTGNRTWSAYISNTWDSSSWTVVASANANQYNRDATRSVNITGTAGSGNNEGSFHPSGTWVRSAYVRQNQDGTVTITVFTRESHHEWVEARIPGLGWRDLNPVTGTEWRLTVSNFSWNDISFSLRGADSSNRQLETIDGNWWRD